MEFAVREPIPENLSKKPKTIIWVTNTSNIGES